MRKEYSAIKKLCNFNSNVSAHYFIKRDGEILNLIPDLYEAWHAGKSNWKSFKSLNKNSIGIEIQNQGHEHGYENFSLKQINSVRKLLKKLSKLYKINKNNILGHSDIAPERKKDPGEKFPWKELAKFKLVKWHSLNEKKIEKTRCLELNEIEKKTILKEFSGLVVIDEAYQDFSGQKSWLENLTQYENLVVLQTFSKAWGLAALRIGIAFAHPEIIKILSKKNY